MRIDGRYTLVSPLGAGGMGTVWQVRSDDGRPFAMKCIGAGLRSSDPSQDRFAEEVLIAAAIKHPHVAEVTDWGVDPAIGPYYVMELLRGEDLDRHVTRIGRVGRTEARRILEQITSALACIHGSDIVHRDLKPSNVFLQGDARTVKLIDFGIAKRTRGGGAGVPSTSIIGSPAWMAPEQIEQGEIDQRTDLWALGLLAFYLLAGRCFWITDPSRHATLLREICLDPLPPASVRARELSAEGSLPDGFDGWFSRCVSRSITARFPDAKTASEEMSRMSKIRLIHPAHATPSPPRAVPDDPEERALRQAIALLRERVPHAVAAMEKNVTHPDGRTPPVPAVSAARPAPHARPAKPPPQVTAGPAMHPPAPAVAPAPTPWPVHPPAPVIPHPQALAARPQAPLGPPPYTPPPNQSSDIVGSVAAAVAVVFALLVAIVAFSALAREPADHRDQPRAVARCSPDTPHFAPTTNGGNRA